MGRGGKGRPAKPTSLKLVSGTRKDRINKHEPKPGGEAPPVEPPGWLTDPAAVAEWERLAPDLEAQGLLTGWDVQSFAEYCAAVGLVAEAEAHLLDEGHVVEGDVFDRNGKATGTRILRNEWSRVLKDALEVSARRAARFGLTPSDRASLSVGGSRVEPGKDPGRLMSSS